MRIRLLVISGLLSVGVAIPCAAQRGCADCDTTFTLDSSFTDGGSIDGTLTLDPATDMFTAADLTVAGFPSYQDGTLTEVGLQGPSFLGYYVDLYSNGSPNADLNLFLDTASLVGYDGSPISFPTNVSFLSFPNDYFAGSGTLEPASVTPEPNSLLLLATGLLGFAGLAWRKAVA